jgi:hypothetical protein
MIPEKNEIIEIDWGHGTGWVRCLVMTNIDKNGYCKCAGQKPTPWKLKLLFDDTLESDKSKNSVKWKYVENEEHIGFAEDRPAKRKKITPSKLTSLPFHHQQIEMMIYKLTKTVRATRGHSYTPYNVLNILNQMGYGTIQDNNRIVSSGNSAVFSVRKGCELYSLLKTVYYTTIDTFDHERQCRFLAQPSILISVSDSTVKGKPHYDSHNIDDNDNMVWCGYFDQNEGYLREKYKFLNFMGRSISTSIEPSTFDAKNEIHQIVFDEDAPATSLRISVIFFQSGRRPVRDRVECLRV